MNKRNIINLRHLVVSKVRFVIAVLLASAIVGCLTWMLVFTSLKESHEIQPHEPVMVLAFVVESYEINNVTYYRLKDFTDEIWVVSDNPKPMPNNIVMLWGTTSLTHSGRSTIDENWRIGSF